jgi:hypothetical protein
MTRDWQQKGRPRKPRSRPKIFVPSAYFTLLFARMNAATASCISFSDS